MSKHLLLLAVLSLAATTATHAQTTAYLGEVRASNNQNNTAGTNYASISSGSTPSLNLVRSVSIWSDTWWNFTMGTDNRLTLGYCTIPQITFQNGAVGIGTTTPGCKAEIASDSPYTLYLSGNAPSLYFGPHSGVFPNDSANFAAGFIGFSSSNGSYGQGAGDLNFATQSFASGNSSGINFLVPANDAGQYQSAMRISRSGNVGIGTTSPMAKLHIHGNYYNNGSGGFLLDASDSGDPEIYALRINPYVLGAARVGYLFQTKSASGGTQIPMVFDNAGNVGIGTTNPTEKLSVNGKIRAKEVIVETAGWSDYVFTKGYKLATLTEVEQHIQSQGHLPGVPSAQEVADKGVSVGDMQAVLLAKIEELTLHVIAQEKEQSAQRAKLDVQAAEIATLKAENAQLKH